MLTLPGGGIFKAASPSPPPPPPPVPVEQNDVAEIAKKRDDQRRLEANRRGRASLVLTSNQGVQDDELGVVTRPQAKRVSRFGG